jgi:hypothetical protein
MPTSKQDPGAELNDSIIEGLPPGIELEEREQALLDLAARPSRVRIPPPPLRQATSPQCRDFVGLDLALNGRREGLEGALSSRNPPVSPTKPIARRSRNRWRWVSAALKGKGVKAG